MCKSTLSIPFLIHYFSSLPPQATIPDPDDSKPEDWDKPEHIADPEATKPDDWDDEMDGEWEPPMIDNPEYKVRIYPPLQFQFPTACWSHLITI